MPDRNPTQAFFRSLNSSPCPSNSPVRKLSLFLSFPMYRRSNLLSEEKGRGLGGGRGTKSYDREKASPSIMFQYSLCIGIVLCFLLESFGGGVDLIQVDLKIVCFAC